MPRPLKIKDLPMLKPKRRPTLDELKEMPPGLVMMEIAQLCVDAALADNAEVLASAEALSVEPDPQPERIVELWNQLHRASGSTEEYSCSYNTVHGASHKPDCDGRCGIMNPHEAIERFRIERKKARRGKPE